MTKHSKHEYGREKIEQSYYSVEDCGYETLCWIWSRGKSGNGYGKVFINGREVLAHRAMYEQKVKPIPRGLEIDHLCRVPACINPAHLEPVTHAENMRRSKNVRVTPAMRAEIRLLYERGAGIREMGRRFNVSHSTIVRALDRVGIRGHS